MLSVDLFFMLRPLCRHLPALLSLDISNPNVCSEALFEAAGPFLGHWVVWANFRRPRELLDRFCGVGIANEGERDPFLRICIANDAVFTDLA